MTSVLSAFRASSSSATRAGDSPVPPTNTLHALDQTHALVDDELSESLWQPLKKLGLAASTPQARSY